MGLQTTERERKAFYDRFRGGESYQVIAHATGWSVECVRYWCRRQRDGQSCRQPRRRTGTGALSRFSPLVRYAVLRLRLEHPRWGPHSILLHLSKRPSLRGQRLPSPAAIGRYLRRWPTLRRARRHRRELRPRPSPAQRVHQRWQVDFKLWVPVAEGGVVHLHTACDEVSGTCIGAVVLPTQPRRKVQMEEARAFVRACLANWNTLPEEIQTDGDGALVAPAAQHALPSRFTLWLKGLGIDHSVIRHGRPTDNAEVERCHRTLNEYVLVGNEGCSAANLQQCLDQARTELLRERPSRAKACQGLPPALAYPDLFVASRPFSPDRELALFDLTRVDAYLATFAWPRLVNAKGQVVIGERRRYFIGRQFAGQDVVVRFDPADRHFVFSATTAGQPVLARLPARGLELSDLTGIGPWPVGQGPQQLPLPFAVSEGVSLQ